MRKRELPVWVRTAGLFCSILAVILGLSELVVRVHDHYSRGGTATTATTTTAPQPTGANDVTGHNNFYFDQVQTPEGVVECVIWIPGNGPAMSCNWGKYNVENPPTTTTVPETTTTLGY